MRNEFQAGIDRLKAIVEEHLFDYLPKAGEGSEALNEAMRYTLSLPGKRVRPVLLLLAYQAMHEQPADWPEAMPYACAIEYIHNYSLIHDDLPAMDDDDLRRGKPTNHKVFGEAMAILAGDGLLSAAFEAMFQDFLVFQERAGVYSGEEFDAGYVVRVLNRKISAAALIADACGSGGMVAGQAADMDAEGKAVSTETLEFIHSNKTAALIHASVAAGALLGGAWDEQLVALSDYGERLGLAFQIADDILDTEGKTEAIGKTAGKDEKAGKATYPAVHGIEASRKRLDELTGQAEEAAGRALKAADGALVLDGGMNGRYVEIMQGFARDLAERVK